MDNLIFIGLPGCGKSTIGAMVAKALALPFYDADIVTERLAGETIPHMFEKGEAYFRIRGNRSDSSALPKESLRHFLRRRCCDEKGKHGPSKKAGTIFFLDRDVEAIIASVDTSTRPLLEEDAEKVRDLDQKRRPLYEGYADVKIPVGSAFKKTAAFIVEICNKRT